MPPMIPKIIHYCWFGRGQKSDFVNSCINSWRTILPDYEIKEWNEDNFDVNICKYTEQAYQARKWAFVADYARLYALYEFGGIYLDTDMMLYKSLDDFLDTEGFFGLESNDYIAMSPIGAIRHNSLIEAMKASYNDRVFILEDGSYDTTTNVKALRQFFDAKGFVHNGKKQKIAGFDIYPQITFLPNTFMLLWGKVPDKSVTVHYSRGTWGSDNQKKNNGTKKKQIYSYFVGLLRNWFGTDTVEKIRSLVKKND